MILKKSSTICSSLGAFNTISFDMPVIFVMNEEICVFGLTKVENLFFGSPSTKRMAATSIILSTLGSRPVVSKSKAT